jgi:hypothetical protein
MPRITNSCLDTFAVIIGVTLALAVMREVVALLYFFPLQLQDNHVKHEHRHNRKNISEYMFPTLFLELKPKNLGIFNLLSILNSFLTSLNDILM